MPFIAIILDLIAAGAYFFQLDHQSSGVFLLGLIFQAFVTILLLFMVFSYKGKRYARVQTQVFVKYVSIRYGIILLSFLINGIVLFLYILNYLDINPLVFSR